jgi:hypothetical protein
MKRSSFLGLGLLGLITALCSKESHGHIGTVSARGLGKTFTGKLMTATHGLQPLPLKPIVPGEPMKEQIGGFTPRTMGFTGLDCAVLGNDTTTKMFVGMDTPKVAVEGDMWISWETNTDGETISVVRCYHDGSWFDTDTES